MQKFYITKVSIEESFHSMKYNFIEIGTSNFDTLIEKADDVVIGISIEPMKKYLDQLPNPKNVKKINCAVSFDGSELPIDFYYIDLETINKLNLKKFLRGCNSIGNYHPMHIQYNLQEHVTIEKVNQRSLVSIFKDYNVDEIDYLKIDTEGGDCKIMQQLYNTTVRPKQIKFETNSLSNLEEVQKIINLYTSLNYKVSYDNKAKRDTILTLTD